MIYTSYEMIADGRAGKPAAWSHLIRNYVPVIRALASHYFPERADNPDLIWQVLGHFKHLSPDLLAACEPVAERPFVAYLRQKLLAFLDGQASVPEPEIPVDLSTLTAALDGFTLVEKQVAWFTSLRYGALEIARMLRMAPQTAEKICDRAEDQLRSHTDTWRRGMIAQNGRWLSRLAEGAHTPECPPSGVFLDLIDGRTTWRGREEMERHVTGCWHCIDHSCRLLEVVDLLRIAKPLTDEEARPYEQFLGLESPRPRFWKRVIAGL